MKKGRNKVRKRKITPAKPYGGVLGSKGMKLIKSSIRKKMK